MKKRHRLLVFFILVALASLTVVRYRSESLMAGSDIQKGIADSIIRFHVRANGDSEKDQQLKLKVKDKVVTYLKPLLAESESIDESREILENHRKDIKELADNTLKELGSDQRTEVYFERCYFPMKSYGDVTFPPGEYEAFRIDIGTGSGKNWWCVLYPPLCFVDATYGVLPEDSKETLENILTDDEYNAITKTQCKYRFKYLTFLNFLFED